MELGDNSVISLNGKSHRVGDLFPSESDVNKGNSYDLSKHGKENQGMQLSIDNGPGRELAGLHVLHPISTGLGKIFSDNGENGKVNMGLTEGVKKTIGLESGVQIEEGIMAQTKDGPN